jgi:tetratricopeptide (TPR) repeat protein
MRAKRATLAQSDNFQAWFLLGFFQYQQANYLLAESSLNQALKINPASADAQYFLGLTFDQQGHRPEALALFKHLVTANPANLDLQKIVANLEAGRPAFASSSPSLSKSKKIKALNL